MSWTKSLRNSLFAPAEGDGDPAFADASSRALTVQSRDLVAPSFDARPSFDAIGQRDETVRQRIDVMVDRLEDLKSLQDDFAELMAPLVRISDELSRASVRIAELETLLAQEREVGAGHRDEASGLAMRLTSVGNALSETITRADRAEGDLKDRSATIGWLHVALRDKTLEAETLDRKLSGASERSDALAAENKALRAEAQTVEATLGRSEHELQGARERLAVLEQDNRRLQALSEGQAGQIAGLGGRHGELEAAIEQERQRARALEAQLATETAARERGEAQFEAETVAHRTERAGLAVKLESAENRAASNEQMLAQTRDQLREKDEAWRTAERNFKEAGAARVAAERRLDTVQDDLARHAERLADMQRLRGELADRSDMLSKALAAKDAALEQAAARSAALAERLDWDAAAHETAREEFDAANRKLVEDLQNERAERALMKGALDIARESRIALQKQHEALRRSARGWRDARREDGAEAPPEDGKGAVGEDGKGRSRRDANGAARDGGRDGSADAEPETKSNVRAFSASAKSS